MVLKRDKYNAAYFGGTETALRHLAGYSDYLARHKTWSSELDLELDDLQEYIKSFIQTHNITGNPKVLELGGALGYYAEYAISQGIRWDVLDVSSWCQTHKVIPDASFILGDAKTILSTLRKNDYDIIISFRFLECIDLVDVPDLITEMNRVAKQKQIHIIGTNENPGFYTNQPITFWQAQGFKTGTVLIDHSNISEQVVV